ncbi:MAG: flavodoxin family protein [Theionarchaea archaeon]|nr:flavodoxin family protein [Theionarchaea archaeon]
MSKVIGISGGRLKGNTDQFLQKALEIISESNIETELIPLADKHIEMDACSRCPSDCGTRKAVCATKDDFYGIFKKMVEADGIILGSPVYWGGIPAKLKEVLNRAGILSEGRVSAEIPVTALGRAAGWPENVQGRGWPETTKGPGLFSRKIGGAVAVAQRDGVLFVLSELCLWFLINDFVICSSNYWVDGLEQVGRTAGGVGGGGTRVPSASGKVAEHVRDILQMDREGAMTLEHFAENFSWLVTATSKVRGTPKEIFTESRLSMPPWMDPKDRSRVLG